MRLITAAALSLCLIAVHNCARGDELEPAPDCAAEPPGDLETLPVRTVELGEVVDGAFTAWVDGDEVALVTGFQGSAMLTPWIELPTQDGDEDGSCWHVQYDHVDDQGEAFGGSFRGGFVFSLVGDVMRTGPIFDVPDGGEGETVHVRVTVTSPEFIAVDEVSVVLRY